MNINMSETTEDSTYCCEFCEYINEHSDVLKNKVLINRIHKCKVLDIFTETQYIEMYEIMKNNQIEAYDKYMEKIKMILSLGKREKTNIIRIVRRGKASNIQNITIIDFLYKKIQHKTKHFIFQNSIYIYIYHFSCKGFSHKTYNRKRVEELIVEEFMFSCKGFSQ